MKFKTSIAARIFNVHETYEKLTSPLSERGRALIYLERALIGFPETKSLHKLCSAIIYQWRCSINYGNRTMIATLNRFLEYVPTVDECTLLQAFLYFITADYEKMYRIMKNLPIGSHTHAPYYYCIVCKKERPNNLLINNTVIMATVPFILGSWKYKYAITEYVPKCKICENREKI